MKYFRKDQIMPSLDIEPKSELKFKGISEIIKMIVFHYVSKSIIDSFNLIERYKITNKRGLQMEKIP